MKYIITIFILLNITVVKAQFIQKNDTTYLTGIKELNIIANEIKWLNIELELHNSLDSVRKEKIAKLERLDSLNTKRLEVYKAMDIAIREKLDKSMSIIDNYKLVIVGKDHEIGVISRNLKKQKVKTTFYKYTLYGVIGLNLYLGVKSLIR